MRSENKTFFIKISLTTFIFSFFLLFLISNMYTAPNLPLDKLTYKEIGTYIQLKGNLSKISCSNITCFAQLADKSTSISLTFFETSKEELKIFEKKEVFVEGRLQMYKGKKNVIVEKIYTENSKTVSTSSPLSILT
ncbi:MAG: OB-fold nucleic acid binding domain-containing protein [Candidatus Woesearchaeota archaeon]|nr:OB-fold nucleic acid binding domain-containing protein [Nanoarchaeota archaeon]USN44273.1 MAG: OB-fold nucleic acid binding domain-containing protein [Candidatus Woesearchaeota archaeon]